MDKDILTLIVVASAALFFILVERIIPYTHGQRIFRDQFWNDLIFYTIVQSYLLGLLIFWFLEWVDNETNFSRFQLIGHWPLWLQIGFFVVTHDLYIYWFHRWQHHNKFLWRIHEAHHSTKEVDWLSGSRSHAFEIMINQTIEFAPIILLGAAPEVALYKGMISAVWGMFIHSNLDINMGWVQKIIIGPQMHRWHHSAIYTGAGKNFATKFAIWDFIFSTAYFEHLKKPERYGLDDVDFPRNYIKQHMFAFRSFKEDK